MAPCGHSDEDLTVEIKMVGSRRGDRGPHLPRVVATYEQSDFLKGIGWSILNHKIPS